MSEIYSTVQNRLNLADQRNVRQYNIRKRDKEFSVSNKVWKRNKVLSDASKNLFAKLVEKCMFSTVPFGISASIYEWLRCW